MVLSKRLQREWIKSELAAAQADREEQKRRQQQADEAHEAMVQIARETRAREDGVSDPLAPEESLCVSIESILDRERQAEARGRQRDYNRWQESKPTWLNAPPASHPIPEQTPSARVGRLLDRPLTETEKLKIEAENRRRRLRGE